MAIWRFATERLQKPGQFCTSQIRSSESHDNFCTSPLKGSKSDDSFGLGHHEAPKAMAVMHFADMRFQKRKHLWTWPPRGFKRDDRSELLRPRISAQPFLMLTNFVLELVRYGPLFDADQFLDTSTIRGYRKFRVQGV